MRALLLGWIACVLIAPMSQAQTIEYEIPTEYELVPGYLSVTFVDTVSEASAQALLFEGGYMIAESNFSPIRVTAASNTPLSNAQIDELRRQPEVLDVRHVDRQSVFGETALPEDAARFQARLSLHPTLTAEAARQIVARLLPDHTIDRVEKRPNEVVITVDEGREDAAVDALSALPQVKYVAFLHAQ